MSRETKAAEPGLGELLAELRQFVERANTDLDPFERCFGTAGEPPETTPDPCDLLDEVRFAIAEVARLSDRICRINQRL